MWNDLEMALAIPHNSSTINRQEFLRRGGLGFGALAVAHLLDTDGLLTGRDTVRAHKINLVSRPAHFPARARAVIQLVQTGGPPQMDLFDRKPELQKRDRQVFEEKAESFQPGSGANQLRACPYKFRRYGECGMELSELLPFTGKIADEICLINSMVSVHNNHTEAIVNLATGKMTGGRPTLGAWISYALGTENQNLPAFVVLRPSDGYATSGRLMSFNGWLPAIYGGTEFNSQGDAIHNLKRPSSIPVRVRRESFELLAKLNERHRQEKYPFDSELDTRIKNYELAARMQLSATDVLDVSKESSATHKLYGIDNTDAAKGAVVGGGTSLAPLGYATRCLMARRLVEAGVRFVQVFIGKGQPWDLHGSLKRLPNMCRVSDQASAALVTDLKNRGLLESTIVMWGGEFGRLPVAQQGVETPAGDRGGRDHNKYAGSFWLAGGGFKSGLVYGATDDVGYRTVDKKFTIPDLFATTAQSMGLDHQAVSYLHAGRLETIADAETTGARVHSELFA